MDSCLRRNDKSKLSDSSFTQCRLLMSYTMVLYLSLVIGSRNLHFYIRGFCFTILFIFNLFEAFQEWFVDLEHFINHIPAFVNGHQRTG